MKLVQLPGITPPLDQQLELDHSFQATSPSPNLDAALQLARTQRIEFEVLEKERLICELELQAARAEYLPVVGVSASYGLGGDGLLSALKVPVHTVMLEVKVPFYDGGLTRGRVQEAQAHVHQVQIQWNDLHITVEQDVREAVQALRTSKVELEAAEHSVALSRRDVQLSSHRFAAGLGNNVEVLSAQTALSDALDLQATARFRYETARLNLASAEGQAETFDLERS